MRLTTWNCHHGTVADRVQQLASLGSDLITLQECRRPDKESSDVLWSGDLPHKGIAVVSRNPALHLERLNLPVPATVLPVTVYGPVPFLLLTLWTQRSPTYERFVLKALTVCAAGGNLPVAVTGDLNITAKAEAIRAMREEFGLVSAYHAHHQVGAGAERHPTHFWRWQQAAPWHIDFCFVPETWVDRVREVRVGGFEEWRDSDHRRVTVGLDL